MRLAFLVLVIFVPLSTSWSQESTKPPGKPLLIPKPEGIDEATWERLKSTQAAKINEFVNVLVEAEKNRVRPDRDTVQEIIRKRADLQEMIYSQAGATLEHLTKADRYLLGNYVFLWAEVSPRLTGTVRKVGANDRGPALGEVLETVKPGDVVLLGEGSYTFVHEDDRQFRDAQWHDIAIVGRGASKTTIKFKSRHDFPACQRVRFEGVKIDCGDNTWCDLREGSMHLRDCYIFNYNSGAGGSSAIDGSNTMLLVEGCTFEGMTGGSAGNGHGVAFDLRGFNILYARKTEFVDNREILRADFSYTLDQCQLKGAGRSWIMSYGVDFAADDRAIIEFVLGERKELAAAPRRLVENCLLSWHVPYWIRLLGHRDEWIRSKAIGRFEALTGHKIERLKDPVKFPAEQVAALIKELDSENFSTRQTAKKQLEEAGESARAQLQAAAEKGSLEQRTRAAQLVETLDSAALKIRFARDQEFTQWMKWYEDNRNRLKWDEKANRYVLNEN